MEHEPVFTSEEAASIRGADLKQGVKAMVWRALHIVYRHGRSKVSLFPQFGAGQATPEQTGNIGC